MDKYVLYYMSKNQSWNTIFFFRTDVIDSSTRNSQGFRDKPQNMGHFRISQDNQRDNELNPSGEKRAVELGP